MPATVHELIGRIIDPRPAAAASPAAPSVPRAARSSAPLSVLIGRILAPEWAAPAGALRAVEIAPPEADPAPLPAPAISAV